ncbi:YybH family protein [Leifsonia sp. ZF2019]|uniref:YybH family protein n=1 Tax=Leifsonia sp. ZF2019 TaxID=2781978 RepID=UPI001CBD0E7D|nr:nuclear transport factor 2 family protein [Leifsonia sp. ZF2019]
MPTTMPPGSLAHALEKTARGLAAMGAGDPAQFIACWERSDDVTLFGAFGTVERGYDDVRATLEWVATRFSAGTLVADHEIVHEGADLAYTVSTERGVLCVDGAPATEITIRVSHVYRLREGVWRLVHRHGDHPPVAPARR